jgi:molybdopterin-guanine dinucleotide biosynthesis protein A
VILAGGRSSRFGRDKAQEMIGGEASLHRITRSAAQVASTVVVVGGEGPLPEGVAMRIPDFAPGEGPVQAVLSAFRALPGKSLLVLACDIPLISSEHLLFLSRPLPPSTEARVPKDASNPMPLSALYGAAAHGVFEERWAAGDRSMRAVLTHLRVEWLDFEAFRAHGLEPLSLADFDTPRDLERIRRRQAKTED